MSLMLPFNRPQSLVDRFLLNRVIAGLKRTGALGITALEILKTCERGYLEAEVNAAFPDSSWITSRRATWTLYSYYAGLAAATVAISAAQHTGLPDGHSIDSMALLLGVERSHWRYDAFENVISETHEALNVILLQAFRVLAYKAMRECGQTPFRLNTVALWAGVDDLIKPVFADPAGPRLRKQLSDASRMLY